MKNLPPQKQQQSDINSLVCLYEQWLPLLAELDELKQNTSYFDTDLKAIKEQQETNCIPPQYPVAAKVKEIKRATVNLVKLRDRVDNVIILKEKIEALEDSSKKVFVTQNYSQFAQIDKVNNSSSVLSKTVAKVKDFKLQQPQNYWGIMIAACLCVFVVGQGLKTPDSPNDSNTQVEVKK